MPFSVQYNTTTGMISGTVYGSSAPNDADFPPGIAQLVFDNPFDVTNQMVDITQTPPVLIPNPGD